MSDGYYKREIFNGCMFDQAKVFGVTRVWEEVEMEGDEDYEERYVFKRPYTITRTVSKKQLFIRADNFVLTEDGVVFGKGEGPTTIIRLTKRGWRDTDGNEYIVGVREFQDDRLQSEFWDKLDKGVYEI